jgi:SAM-dependent methyltransferase
MRGVVLDIGPGSGTQMPYFVQPAAKENVSAYYGAEPCVGLHAELRRQTVTRGLEDKYHILSCTADKKELVDALRREGVQVNDDQGVFDTMVCIRVLCSVPNPEKTISDLYSLLRPGGQMLVVEHVINPFTLFGGKKEGSLIARCLQTVYSFLGWSFLLGDCHLDRDTETYLRKAAERDGGWGSLELERNFAWATLPYIAGVLVKRE